MKLFRRGRVLQATFGCNPNSSSLGVDVTFLLFGAGIAPSGGRGYDERSARELQGAVRPVAGHELLARLFAVS